MSVVGSCPYCDDGIVKWDKKNVLGKQTKVYSCTNAKFYSEDGELFERTSDSKCGFQIWGNSLAKYGKKFIGPNEVKRLLNDESVEVRLFSYRAKKEYFKYIYLSQEYGVSVDWDSN